MSKTSISAAARTDRRRFSAAQPTCRFRTCAASSDSSPSRLRSRTVSAPPRGNARADERPGPGQRRRRCVPRPGAERVEQADPLFLRPASGTGTRSPPSSGTPSAARRSPRQAGEPMPFVFVVAADAPESEAGSQRPSGAARHERRADDRDLQGGRPPGGVRVRVLTDDFKARTPGHTRMATKAASLPRGRNLSSTGHDLCLVHNGSPSEPQPPAREPKPGGHRLPDRERHGGGCGLPR